jgi:hypothetical protein
MRIVAKLGRRFSRLKSLRTGQAASEVGSRDQSKE